MTRTNVCIGRAIKEDAVDINSTSTAYSANPMLLVKPFKTASVHNQTRCGQQSCGHALIGAQLQLFETCMLDDSSLLLQCSSDICVLRADAIASCNHQR